MKQQLEAIRASAMEAILGTEKAEDLEALRVKYLGKKGELTAVLKQMGKLSPEERPVIGQLANEVRGKLEQDFDLVCSRCGKDFDDTVKVGDFTASFEIPENSPEVDLTEEIRESIILALPTYPVCDETCPGIEQTETMPSDDRWNVLDSLNKGEKENGKS